MSQSNPHELSIAQGRLRPWSRWLTAIETCSPANVLELALFLRCLAALAVDWYVRQGVKPRVCIFPDADYYWALAGTILEGRTYEIVEWGDIPRFAQRTPGYPLFLAGCRAILGDRPLGVRLVQAILGTLSVWLVYRLTRELTGRSAERSTGRVLDVPMLAAILTALHPYFLVMSALLLSEAVFVPLLVAALWGMAVLWNRLMNDATMGIRDGLLLPFAVGATCGAAVLVRPSCSLFIPLMICGWLYGILRPPHRRRARLSAGMSVACMIALGFSAAMAPWWVRNAHIFGRFVPTAVWMGASLYDGLNPGATGGSDMRFLADPEFWPLDELDQDQRLRQRAIEFAREHPGRVLELAVVKLGKFWCPWPSAEGVSSWPLTVASATLVGPVLLLTALGLWEWRRDLRVWVLLAGPLLYFCAVHLVFASSMRYRIPAEVPAMGLAAAGFARVATELSGGRRPLGGS